MKRTAEKILLALIELLEVSLEELGESTNEFEYGEKTAYVECLELIRYWEFAEKFGLDFEIEERYTL